MRLRNAIGLALLGFGAWQWKRQREYANITPIKNKVVLVTGASSGIGRATARAFAIQGAHVVLMARRANLLAELQDELSAFDVRVLSIAGDVTEEADVQTVIDETLREFGRIDVLVNNAGVRQAGYIEDTDPDWTRRVFDVNIYGTTRMVQAVLPIMKTQHSGHIVNVSSVSALIPASGQTIYGATKSAMTYTMDSLRRELHGTGVRVSALHPGWTRTDMVRNEAIFDQIPGTELNAVDIQTPAFVASHVVATVRYNRATVVLGGIGFKVMALCQRFAPALVDWYMAWLYPPEKLVPVMRDLDS
jgi:NADP-dependent 3-hydroxy acid dehydrogenase YdfG